MALWNAQWDELLAVSGKKPFFNGAVRVRREGPDTVLSLHMPRAIGVAVVQIVVIAGLIAGGFAARWYGHANPEAGTLPVVIGYVLMGVGTLSFLAWLRGVYGLFFSPRFVRLSPQPPQVTIARGWQPLVFPAAGLTARLRQTRGPVGGLIAIPNDISIAGLFRLELAANDADAGDAERALCLASAGTKDQLRPAYARLRALLGGAVDETLRRVTLPDGSDVLIDDQAVAKAQANFRVRKLVMRTETHAVIRPTRFIQAFLLPFLAMGLLVVGIGLTQTGAFESVGHRLLVIGFGCLFALPGVLALLGVFNAKPIDIDLSRGVMEISRGSVPVPELTTGMPLSRLAALQLCTYVVRGKNTSTTMYELNAILRGEDGLRVSLLNDSNRRRLEQQAVTLMNMLRLPVIDSVGKAAA